MKVIVHVYVHVHVHYQERESQKLKWLQRCVDELANEKWVIPALKQMREICLLYLEVCVLYALCIILQNGLTRILGSVYIIVP